MCQPDYFQVAYEINPWMRLTHQPDRARSLAQWNELYRVLKKAGTRISLISPQSKCPDLVFTANAGVVFRNTFLASRFRFPERGGEEPHFRKWFRDKGYRVRTLPPQHFFEGEGDLLFKGGKGGIGFFGWRFRSERRVQPKLESWLARPVVPLELADKRFYHLDTCFLPLDEKTVLYYPGAFTPFSRCVIRDFVPNAVAVTEREAVQFVLNGVVIDRTLVTNSGCSARTKAVIRRCGLRLVELDLSEFHKSGGSAKCLTLYLLRSGGE